MKVMANGGKKQKRSEKSLRQNPYDSNDAMDMDQLEFPISFELPFDFEANSENVSIVDEIVDESIQQVLQKEDNVLSNINDNDETWFARHRKSFQNITENHRKRKEKLLKFIQLFLKSASSNYTLTGDFDDSNEQESPDIQSEPKLTFKVMRGNSTIVNLTPKQLLQMFYRGSDEHAELQKRAKMLLQRAFYKYARLYLFARKGYKDTRSFNRMVKKSHKSFFEDGSVSTESSQSESTISKLSENLDDLNNLNDNDYDSEKDFMTNDARTNFHALEGFAILVLEIFGAMLGLTLGAMAQIQAGFIIDI